MDHEFETLQRVESEWPLPSPDGKMYYDDFYEQMHRVSVNHVFVSCACADHSHTARSTCAVDIELLRPLRINAEEVPFSFLCGVESLDTESIMIDKLGLSLSVDGRPHMYLCASCHKCLWLGELLPEALANRRWLGPQPPELQDLSWIESIVITRGHMAASIVRLQKSGGMNSAYFGIKGHAIIVPQDTTQLLDILPLPPSTLPDHVHVVWTGAVSDTPRPHQLKHLFTVNTEKVRAALIWLKVHHTGYQSVMIDNVELDRWPPVFVTQELMDSIA
jgi:hypothetical protein